MYEPSVKSEGARAQDLTSPSPPHAAAEDPLDELLEMRYQQHLAQRALQELFEEGALQTLES